jgi:zinc transport system ATP-binding protein
MFRRKIAMVVDNDRLVDARGVGVRRNGRWLVRGIDLAVRRGEIVTLIGPNGSGKSTTAKAVLGLMRPDEGAVTRRAGLTVGYVPQKLGVDWTLPLTVDRLMTLTGRHDRAAVADALGEVGVGHLAGAEVAHLSGGEFQRVMLARALVRKPGLLVLDEPTQGVDAGGEIALYDLITEIRARTGCGILLISHDLHVVMAATDTVICLNGHVCCHGSPQTVAGHPEYARLFGARAAEALAIYRHRHDHVHALDGSVASPDHAHDHGHDHSHDHADHGSRAHA